MVLFLSGEIEMSNYAIVENGIVTNIIVWDGETKYDAGVPTPPVLIPDGAFVTTGYLWDTTNGFTAPPVTDPAPTQPVTQ